MTIYLYVKQHSRTGLKYFGKTVKDPYSYLGSGTRWCQHIRKHGTQYVETIDFWAFENQEDASKFAIEFSNINDIVNSENWANLVIEDAKDGTFPKGYTPWNKGKKMSSEFREKCSKRRKPLSEEHKRKLSEKLKSKSKSNPLSEEHKRKLSESKKGQIPWNKGKTLKVRNN